MVLKGHERQGPIARQKQPMAAEFEEEKADIDRQRCKCCWSFLSSSLVASLLKCTIYFVKASSEMSLLSSGGHFVLVT